MTSISAREAYGQALVELGRERTNVVVLEADLAKSTRSVLFRQVFPHRFFDLGVAEQNMIGVAAGLATMGLVPFASTLAIFASQRALNQIYVSVAYPCLNVKIVGTHCGLQAGGDGPTHQALNDVAIMRSIPGMTVIEPADAFEVRGAVRAAYDHKGPVYLRLGRNPVPAITAPDQGFIIGKAASICDYGNDVTLVSSGAMTYQALQAAQVLKGRGVLARLLHMPTIKPLDTQEVLRAARETGVIVTCEEHSVVGGLGGAVAEVIATHGGAIQARIGVTDTFAESGETADLYQKYGLGVDRIVQVTEDAVKLRACR
jgi:transketolase